MLSPLSATRPKRSAFQSTTIFRLPTPRKPPKSMTAARTTPARSTITSTMCPMSSSAGLRTSRPSTPCASLAPMTVTEGGGAGCLGAAAGAVSCGGDGCEALRSACGAAASFCARELAAASVAKATAMKMNGRLARIRPPFEQAPPSMREHDRHLDPAAGAQDLERHLVAVAADPKVDAGRSQFQFSQHHFVEKRRQTRVAQADFAALGVKFEPERRLQQRERRRARPGLRRAGDGIERRAASLFTAKAAEQLR